MVCDSDKLTEQSFVDLLIIWPLFELNDSLFDNAEGDDDWKGDNSDPGTIRRDRWDELQDCIEDIEYIRDSRKLQEDRYG